MRLVRRQNLVRLDIQTDPIGSETRHPIGLGVRSDFVPLSIRQLHVAVTFLIDTETAFGRRHNGCFPVPIQFRNEDAFDVLRILAHLLNKEHAAAGTRLDELSGGNTARVVTLRKLRFAHIHLTAGPGRDRKRHHRGEKHHRKRKAKHRTDPGEERQTA